MRNVDPLLSLVKGLIIRPVLLIIVLFDKEAPMTNILTLNTFRYSSFIDMCSSGTHGNHPCRKGTLLFIYKTEQPRKIIYQPLWPWPYRNVPTLSSCSRPKA